MSDELSARDGMILMHEVVSTRNLLRDGLAALRAVHYTTATNDSVFTLLSIGVLKLARLSLGFISLRDTGHWPSTAAVSRLDLLHFCQELQHSLEANSVDVLASAYEGSPQAAFESDPLWPLVLECLDSYGRSAHAAGIDQIGGDSPGEFIGSKAYWRLQEVIHHADLVGANDLLAPFLPLSSTDRGFVNATIADRIEWWWAMIHGLWARGLLGPRGAEYSSFMRPPV